MENELLQKEIAEKMKSGVDIMPVAHVNGVAVNGTLGFATIFKAICAGFKSGTQPEICTDCAKCSDVQQCVLDGDCVSGTYSN